MNPVSSSAAPDWRPCYRMDSATGEWVKGAFDWNEVLKAASARKETEETEGAGELRIMWVLETSELQALAEKYDVRHMTKEELDRFALDLEDLKVLKKGEHLALLPGIVFLDPENLITAQFRRPGQSVEPLPAPELEDFDGDALAWLKELSVWSLSQWQDSRKAEICRRAASVLEHMAELQGAPV